jgi:hypothetical protein
MILLHMIFLGFLAAWPQAELPPSAAPSATPAPAPAKGGSALEFEVDVVEGQRLAPKVFTDLETEPMDLDALVYQREDFNDFHAVEKGRRLRFQVTK